MPRKRRQPPDPARPASLEPATLDRRRLKGEKVTKQSQNSTDGSRYIEQSCVQKTAVAEQRNKANLHGFFMKRGVVGQESNHDVSDKIERPFILIGRS